MPTFRMLVMSNPAAGREAEFDRWYDETHLADVVATPGFLCGQRFRVTPVAGLLSAPSPYQSYALYEIETDDIQATVGALMSRNQTTALPISGAFDLGGALAVILEPTGAPVRKA